MYDNTINIHDRQDKIFCKQETYIMTKNLNCNQQYMNKQVVYWYFIYKFIGIRSIKHLFDFSFHEITESKTLFSRGIISIIIILSVYIVC